MIKESLDSLETKLGKRKQFLFDNDLEKLQQEFLDKKEKCNTKIIKNSQSKKENEKNKNNFTIPTGEIKKKKGKKKVKDVISLNLPPLNNENDINSNEKKSENVSLFSLNYNKIEEKNKNRDNNATININKITGLPDTFKIETIDNGKNGNEDKNINEKNEIKKMEIDIEDIKEEEFNSKEYDEINKENQKKIEQMSKEEIMEAQKEIFASIPSELLEKFKSNFFTQQIKKSLHEKENNILKEIQTEEKKDKENNNIKDIENEIKIEKEIIKENINSNLESKKESKEEIILFSYEGKIKKENKEKYLIDNPEMKETIDYRFLTFDQLELKNKFFSLAEINALLSSSNNLQISIGLRITINLLKNKYHLTLDIFIDQIDSLFNKLYYLMNSTNLNIKSESLECLSLLYHDFFYDDYKIFKFNSILIGLYPSIVYFNFNNMSKNVQKQKKLCIKSIQENGYENINEYINILRNGGINEDINNNLLTLIFYTIYVNEKIPCKLSKLFEINFDILSKKQCLVKLMAILSDCEELEKNIKFFDKLIKNKFFWKYLVEIRGLGNNSNSSIIGNYKNKKSSKDKIYDLNYLLLFNNNNSITYDIYSKEKDFLLLSKILKSKVFFCLNIENNNENDNVLSLVNSDSELNFWTDKFKECIKKLKDDEHNIEYIELMSIYQYITNFLYLWHKAFKYPQLIAYKKINFDLKDILNLFPLFNKILIQTLNNIIFNDKKISSEKNDIIRNIYPYSTLLDMNLNYLKCFIKNYDEKTNINGMGLYFIKLSEFINKGDEYYYRKYTKILKTFLSKKLSFSKINNINDFFDYKEIEEDLNFYLYSNDDLRKSTFYKRIFSLINNNERLNNLNLVLTPNVINVNNEKIFDSKYFPFDSNFIYQILSNDKSKVSIKINYLIILTLLYENENIENIISNTSNIITPFEIVIKIILAIKLSEFNTNKKLYNLFKIFIRYNIIQGKLENINISLNDNNKIIMGNFFELYDSNYFIDENIILIEIIPLLFIFLHNNKKNENNNLLEPFRYKKTIESIVYDNFNFISQYKNYFDINEEEKNNIIEYLIDNISIMFASFYQTLIMSFLNYKNNLKDRNNNNKQNIICEYAQKLCDVFGVKREEYKNYVGNEELLKELIKKQISLIKKNKLKL